MKRNQLVWGNAHRTQFALSACSGWGLAEPTSPPPGLPCEEGGHATIIYCFFGRVRSHHLIQKRIASSRGTIRMWSSSTINSIEVE